MSMKTKKEDRMTEETEREEGERPPVHIHPRLMRTFLVQRLAKPHKDKKGNISKVHRVFGGGMLGLSKEAWDLIDPIFRIEYMGSAEFEFGKIPEVLHWFARACNEGKVEAFSMVLQPEDIKPSIDRQNEHDRQRRKEIQKHKKAGTKPPKAKSCRVPFPKAIYVIAPTEWRDQVEDRIRELAVNKIHTKEITLFNEMLDDRSRVSQMESTCGWLELNNGFFFFTDLEMHQGVCNLFEVKPAE